MLKYQIYQSKLAGTSAYGKFYARIVTDQSIDVASLAEHMANHNTPFSRGTASWRALPCCKMTQPARMCHTALRLTCSVSVPVCPVD